MSLVELSVGDKTILKHMALASIRSAVLNGCPLPMDDSDSDVSRLSFLGACFITILKQGGLRGCVGTIEAYRPLYQDVIHNAYNAAMNDPRFPAVESDELEQLELSISLLTEPQEVIVETETELLSKIVPRVDGVIIQEGHRRATYLPSVWEQLPERIDFICQLKSKAGLPHDYWSNTIKCFKYQVELIK